MIPNRNHSRYLGGCIESALNQTYENVDIVVIDNCSDDNSVEIACQYGERNVRVCKNPVNIANKSFELLTMLTEGEYMILLCADDMIQPTFIEKSVHIMEKYPNVGYVHCERDYIDENGNIADLDPFFKCSFIAPGESALPIYLLTDVAQASQCVMRRSAFHRVYGYNTEFDHGNADIDLWFRLSLVSDYAYIKEKLSLIRIHRARETLVAFRSFYHALALYLMVNYHCRLGGEQEGHKNVLARASAAYRKIAAECLQIASFCLREDNPKLMRQYLLFAELMDEHISEDSRYKQLLDAYHGMGNNTRPSVEKNEPDMFNKRKRGYDPPEGFKRIELSDYGNK